jgi:hypothetical protein
MHAAKQIKDRSLVIITEIYSTQIWNQMSWILRKLADFKVGNNILVPLGKESGGGGDLGERKRVGDI